MVAVLDATLARFEEQYDVVFRNLSTLRTIASPTAEDAMTLLTTTPNNAVARQFFFEGLENPAWVSLLSKREVFRFPPPPIVDAEGRSVSHVPWPESRYLARMARRSEAQGTVVQAIDGMEETENVSVVGDLIDALSSLPVSLGRSARERVLRWAERHEQLFHLIPRRLTEFATHLATNGEIDAAKDILRILLTLIPPAQGKHLAPRARIEPWDYRRVLREGFADIGVALSVNDRLEFLLELLERSATSEGGMPGQRVPTHFWRSSIEETGLARCRSRAAPLPFTIGFSDLGRRRPLPRADEYVPEDGSSHTSDRLDIPARHSHRAPSAYSPPQVDLRPQLATLLQYLVRTCLLKNGGMSLGGVNPDFFTEIGRIAVLPSDVEGHLRNHHHETYRHRPARRQCREGEAPVPNGGVCAWLE